jgi:hypothetical protein
MTAPGPTSDTWRVEFDTADEARDAAVRLERHGLDGSKIELSGPGMAAAAPDTPARQARADRRAVRRFGKDIIGGGLVGAVMLAAAAAAVLVAVQPDNLSMLLMILVPASALVGFAIGAFLYTETRLPAGHEALDGFGAPAAASVALTVTSEDPADLDTARRVLGRSA